MTQPLDSSFVVANNMAGLPCQDYIVLGNGGGFAKSPGKATVKGLPRPHGWDERQGSAMQGATLAPKWDPLARFTVTVEVWSGAQYQDWLSFAAVYLSKAALVVPGTVTSRALAIVHPQVNDPPYCITEVVVENTVAQEETDDGRFCFDISFIEYRKPVPAIGLPSAAIPVAQKPPPTAADKNLDAARKAVADAKALAPPVPS